MVALVHEPLIIYQPKTAPAKPGAASLFQRLITGWQFRREDRVTYARMNERDLRDAGVSRFEIERELARPFWRE